MEGFERGECEHETKKKQATEQEKAEAGEEEGEEKKVVGKKGRRSHGIRRCKTIGDEFCCFFVVFFF